MCVYSDAELMMMTMEDLKIVGFQFHSLSGLDFEIGIDELHDWIKFP